VIALTFSEVFVLSRHLRLPNCSFPGSTCTSNESQRNRQSAEDFLKSFDTEPAHVQPYAPEATGSPQ